MTSDDRTEPGRSDFIRDIIEDDLRTGKHDGRVVTRFPPEPNGYLHIGHAKSICLNFGVAEQYEGHCNLRFDDTNPLTEGVEYVESIAHDVKWLGFSYGDRAFYASDYFEEMYQLAEDLINQGKAYVDHLSDEEIIARCTAVRLIDSTSMPRPSSRHVNTASFSRRSIASAIVPVGAASLTERRLARRPLLPTLDGPLSVCSVTHSTRPR